MAPIRSFRLLTVFLAVALSVTAQTGTVPVAAPLPAQALGPNDLIGVTVFGVPELSRSLRIGEDGLLWLPLLAQPIHATGKLPPQLESEIADALRKNELVTDPAVTVTVTEYFSRPVTITGAVHNPTTIQALAGLNLLEAITRAGGLTDDAGPEILVGSAGTYRQIPVKSLMTGQSDEFNPLLRGGDEVRIPRAPRIFVLGSVRKPGMIALVESSGTTVLKALSLAEGLAPFATKEAWILRPNTDSGQRQDIRVDLAGILRRKSPDVPLKADDIFYVPDNKAARVTIGILDRVASFGAATASGILIWRL